MNVAFPPLDDTIPLEETLRIIDEAVEKQQRVIDELYIPLLALKSRRNASVPISRLPPEILCRIFSFVRVSVRDSWGLQIPPLQWINVTYVCRHWRRVAVNAPSLWVDPPIGNYQWVAEMLRRSKKSNLIIKVTDSRVRGMELALEDTHRIEELSMRHISPDTWSMIGHLLPVSAPRLERFCLEGQNLITYLGGVAHPWERIYISEHYLRETGSLRRLELVHCSFNWISHSHLLCSLTHLKLHHLSHVKRCYLSHLWEKSTLEFMDMFKNMPNLEVLDLNYAFPSYQTLASQLSEEIHFPRLRILHIQDSLTPELKAFFRNVTFPPTTMVKIVCHYKLDAGRHEGESNDDDGEPKSLDLSDIISGLARSYSKLHSRAVFQGILLRQTSEKIIPDPGIRLNLFAEMLGNFNISSRSVDAISRLQLVFYCGMDPVGITPHSVERQEIAQLLNDICTSGMLDDITEVCLPSDMPCLSMETIANTLGRLPCVHSVMVARDATRTFLNAIRVVHGSRGSAAVTSASSRNSELGFSFPSLTSISLYCVHFVASHLVEHPKYAHAISTEQLQDILMHRCDFGLPIDKLCLHECVAFYAEDKELLREIVVDVDGDVDPETYSSSDESEEDDEDEYSDSSAEIQDSS